MRKHFLTLAFLALAGAAFFASCKKEDKKTQPQPPQPQPYVCTTCTTTPDANAAYDGSSKGIYKGVVIGSSGTIKFDIANDSSAITATMIIDGQTVVLTSTVAWTGGQSYVAPFVGVMNGDVVTINFSVDFDGSNPVITSANIPGHPNAVFTLLKETSNALIECFEGTYSTTKPANGTFNILLARQIGKWGGVARENGVTEKEDINGMVDGSGKILDDQGRQMGTLSGDEIDGEFQDSNHNTVTIHGQRTL